MMTQKNTLAIGHLDARRFQATDKTRWLFIELVTDDGETGLGEFTIAGADADIAAAVSDARAQMVGAHPGTRASELALLACDNRIQSAVYTACDQAVLDLLARRERQSLAAFLGAADADTASVRLYANINRGTTDRSPDSFGRRAGAAIRAGYDAVKIAPFDELSTALCHSGDHGDAVDAGLARISAVRDAIGAENMLMVDCHWRFTEHAAQEIIPELAALNVGWFECPLPEVPENIQAIAALRRRANDQGMLTAGCEKFTGWPQFEPYVRAGAYDVIMPDAKYVGGFAEAASIAEAARGHGIKMSLHNPSGPICHAFSLHATAALSLPVALEYQYDETAEFDAIVDGDLPDRNGRSGLPTGPGLGIRLKKDRIEPI